jgi:hypothetical protein
MKRQKNVRAKKFQSKKIVADFIFLPSNFFAVQFFCRPIFLPSNFFAVQFFCRPIFLPSNFFAVLLPLFIFQTQTLPKAFETPRNNSL